MANNYQGRTNNHRSNTPIALTIDFTDESYVDDAELVILTMKKAYYNFKVSGDELTTNQIRNLLTLTTNIYEDLLSRGPEAVMNKLSYLRVQLVYQSGRNKAVAEFIRLAQLIEKLKIVQKSGNKQDILRYCRYMEALVAYFKYHGGKNS
ncbi:type III-A CRISPR-associated protein Csm2 [Fundicoccus culcitae]|uniref:CRISPR system Cms protein Csm2 n=1 Tax=Fundicoccus culcitae TaxID=2969821 RepID=A0ABY5P4R0_9LACT|nr:type III-A CRISPR-associated protein Csm2 [Fundicoccus culcitae]UUX33727.1 type III-A CRISPR-associated protein Csm2 [Fundicoccus culcitae]